MSRQKHTCEERPPHLFAGVGEGHAVERQHGRRQLVAVRELEHERVLAQLRLRHLQSVPRQKSLKTSGGWQLTQETRVGKCDEGNLLRSFPGYLKWRSTLFESKDSSE